MKKFLFFLSLVVIFSLPTVTSAQAPEDFSPQNFAVSDGSVIQREYQATAVASIDQPGIWGQLLPLKNDKFKSGRIVKDNKGFVFVLITQEEKELLEKSKVLFRDKKFSIIPITYAKSISEKTELETANKNLGGLITLIIFIAMLITIGHFAGKKTEKETD